MNWNSIFYYILLHSLMCDQNVLEIYKFLQTRRILATVRYDLFEFIIQYVVLLQYVSALIDQCNDNVT